MNLKEAEETADTLDFKKGRGLIVAVAQDSESKEVLMVAFMNRNAFLKTLTTGRMWYYSRSRKKLWMKGETSGNFQLVEGFRVDCDADAVLFKVKQIGNACHTGNRTCFFKNEKELSLEELFSLILDRKKFPRDGSYTNELLRKQRKLLAKIKEESDELTEAVEFKSKKEVIWEACDLLYHVLVLLAKKEVNLNDVYLELGRRRR
ncbi:MAG: bifunctional phosphoribosyl-AMP cyclohydrolase/phosphoribosyl-ATP diphosphatase HisIE [Candidatus Micrarchaeia archaeon]